MLDIKDTPMPAEKWEETARKNAEDFEQWRQFLIKFFSDAAKAEKERNQRLADVQSGKIRRKIMLGIGITVNEDYTEIRYNGKKKTLRKGDQKQLVIECLAEASKREKYKVSTGLLQKYLMDNWKYASVRGVNYKTIQGVRDGINQFFKEKIIDSDGKGNFYLNRGLLEI